MNKSIKFTVSGNPLSMNHAYPTGKDGRRHLSAAAKSYKEDIGWIAKGKMMNKSSFINVMIKIDFYFKNNMTDTNNCIKLILDAMEGIVYVNDRQIVEEHYFRKFDKKNPRFEIIIEEYFLKN